LRQADENDGGRREVLYEFCDSYGEGYVERKKLLSKVYME
jgi:hypothetical protein